MNVLKQLYLTSDYHDESGMIFNADCMEIMSSIKQGGVFDVTLTDIPYDMVNHTISYQYSYLGFLSLIPNNLPV